MTHLRFECSLCGGALEAEVETSGSTIQCPHCSRIIKVPSVGIGGHASKTEATAIWSFVLSLVGLFCLAHLASIPAVICGHVALSKIKKSQLILSGRGLAIAGVIVGYIGICLWTIYAVILLIAALGGIK
jgi:hypothetical protein